MSANRQSLLADRNRATHYLLRALEAENIGVQLRGAPTGSGVGAWAVDKLLARVRHLDARLCSE